MIVNKLIGSMILVGLCLIAFNGYAQGSKIGFVNATRVFEESTQYKKARDRLQEEFSRREKEILSGQKQLKQLEDKLQIDGTTMTESEVKRLERDILSRRRKLKNSQTEFREDLNLRQNEEFKKLRERIREVIQEVGQSEKFDLIVSDGVVYFSEKIDISDMVLEKLNNSSN